MIHLLQNCHRLQRGNRVQAGRLCCLRRRKRYLLQARFEISILYRADFVNLPLSAHASLRGRGCWRFAMYFLKKTALFFQTLRRLFINSPPSFYKLSAVFLGKLRRLFGKRLPALFENHFCIFSNFKLFIISLRSMPGRNTTFGDLIID